jgi:hypothetical protein
LVDRDLQFNFGALPLPFARWFFSSGSYSYPCVRPWPQQQYDQCDQVEKELEAAQSKTTVLGNAEPG